MSRSFIQRKRTWLAGLLVLGTTLGVWHWREIVAALQQLEWSDIQAAVQSAGPWAPILCIALNAIFTLLFLPTTLICAIVALLFGITRGLPICLAGVSLGMAGSFCISRYVARDWIEKKVAHTPLFQKLEKSITTEGWRLVFFTRLLPINPYGVLNYAYGLTRISFTHYIIASTIGVIPNTLAILWTTTAAGQIMRGQMDWKVLAILFSGAALFATLAWLPRHLRKRSPCPPDTNPANPD